MLKEYSINATTTIDDPIGPHEFPILQLYVIITIYRYRISRGPGNVIRRMALPNQYFPNYQRKGTPVFLQICDPIIVPHYSLREINVFRQHIFSIPRKMSREHCSQPIGGLFHLVADPLLLMVTLATTIPTSNT